jgi:hypothetical protein
MRGVKDEGDGEGEERETEGRAGLPGKGETFEKKSEVMQVRRSACPRGGRSEGQRRVQRLSSV